ncbi:MAG TPA: hypothetical protein PLM53_19490 [Spirochaetota bacterium]|nr:hypothetical protein [Spirochaetota bacterium]HPC43013.1 hypothetical protein [Spirochaetota bacterium]HPL17000.1 hypothetical protein [Spirochaetota bacterium]HQF10404.1 hypothetical protein [Spirochaetota bacterium]HQH99277.1 hypothetical protein [Spirochaetota bacterium]
MAQLKAADAPGPPWLRLGITEAGWRVLAAAFYDLAHDDFRKFGELPDSLRECSAGRLCSRYIETGDRDFVERAGREITGSREWHVYLGRMM